MPVRIGCALILSLLSVSAYSAAASPVDSQLPSRYFEPTGYSVTGSFLSFFDRYGGLRIFGYPISGPLTEGGRQVQYFERQRFEYHPESAGTPYEVELSRLGVEFAPQAAVNTTVIPFQSLPGREYCAPTAHSLGSPFLSYWNANGGLRILGYPISEQVRENGLTVQYFERARMEYHPEKAVSGYVVELGLLGKMYIASHAEVASALADARTGSPTSRGMATGGAAQSGTSAAMTPLNDKESALMGMINEARRQAGAGPVSVEPAIRVLALARSKDMVARGYFSHISPDGTDFMALLRGANISFMFTGEIITNNNYSNSTTAREAYLSFMSSPHHHDIMLDPRYTQSGIGEVVNGSGYHYYTVIFLQK